MKSNDRTDDILGRIENLMSEEEGIKTSADALREAAISSLARQVTMWRRSAIALLLAFTVLVVTCLGIFLVLIEMRESQLDIETSQRDISTLVDFVERTEEAREIGEERLANIDKAVSIIIRLEQEFCSLPDINCEGEAE